MKNLWQGLRYGNAWTRLIIALGCILSVVAIGGIAVSFFINSMGIFLGGVACGIGVIILYQRLELHIDEEEIGEHQEEDNKKRKKLHQKTGYSKEIENPQEEKDIEEVQDIDKETTLKRDPKTTEEVHNQGEYLKVDEGEEKEEQDQDIILNIDEKQVKRIFYRYKVKKDHKLILIDQWESKKIAQCPAYVWRNGKNIHFLLLHEPVEEIKVNLKQLEKMIYHRGVICHSRDEYPVFKKESLMTKCFSPYLPSYHQGNKEGKIVYFKNLYEFGSGIKVTNKSVKNLMELTQAQFMLDDGVTRDLRYMESVKELYRQSILFRDEIYNAQEYKAQMSRILQEFATMEISDENYVTGLRQMEKLKLITAEYVEYYGKYRDRLRQEEQKKVIKRKNRK